jgi:hypothetical protein
MKNDFADYLNSLQLLAIVEMVVHTQLALLAAFPVVLVIVHGVASPSFVRFLVPSAAAKMHLKLVRSPLASGYDYGLFFSLAPSHFSPPPVSGV